jgi:putative tryptophan/tyrosine transport system substrate-binding protein
MLTPNRQFSASKRLEITAAMSHMRRREFITLLGGAAAWPLAAWAQQGERVRRIGVLMNVAADDPEGQARLTAFVQGLQQLGWTDGRNVRIDYRWGGGDADRIRRYAAELVAIVGMAEIAVSDGLSRWGQMLSASSSIKPIPITSTASATGS